MAVPSWPFGRRRAEPTPEPDGVAGPDAAGTAGAADVVERPRGQWRELAPLDRVVSSVLEQPVVASAPRFVQELPSRWTAPPAIQPLGHDVRPDLVGGVVRGLASTVAATTAAARESDVADLRWWRGRSARRRAAARADNTAELSIPSPPRAPAADDEEIADVVVPLPATEPAPTRSVSAGPLPRTTPTVASRRPPVAAVTLAAPAYPTGTLPPGPPEDAESSGPVVPFEPPAELTPAVAAPLAGQPVQVVRVNPGAEPAPSPQPDPAGPGAPSPTVAGRPERRRRTWLGAPLPPTADLAAPPIAPVPPALRRAAPADLPITEEPPSTVDGPADASSQPTDPHAPTPLLDGPPTASSGAVSPEWRDISRHSTNSAPLDAGDAPAIEAVPESDPAPAVAPGLDVTYPLTPVRNPPRDERLREEPPAAPTPRPVNPIVAPERAPTTPVIPAPAIRSVRTITSRAAATTAPAVASAAAITAAGAEALAPIRNLGQTTAELYDGAAPSIPGTPAVDEGVAPRTAPAAPGGSLGAAAGLLGRAAAALPAPLASLTHPRMPLLAAPRPAPTRPALPAPIELVAPGIAPTGPAAAALAAAGPVAVAGRQVVDGSSADEDPAPTDPAELDRLAGQLYGRIQRHLNADLLIGRERAQMLTDLG